MKFLAFLLLTVFFCVVSAKYLPEESHKSRVLLWRQRRSVSENVAPSESNGDISNESNENESVDSIMKQERKKLEKHLKQLRKKEEQERKLQEKIAKEERRKQELLEKEKRKQAELEKENKSVDLEDIWKNHIYDKFGVTANSSKLEKKIAYKRYMQEEFGLQPNSTKSEKRQAIIKIINDMQNNQTQRNSFQELIVSRANAAAIQQMQGDIENKIAKLNNKTELMNKIGAIDIWFPQAKQEVEEKKTLYQSLAQLFSSINWLNNNQSTNVSVDTTSSGILDYINQEGSGLGQDIYEDFEPEEEVTPGLLTVPDTLNDAQPGDSAQPENSVINHMPSVSESTLYDSFNDQLLESTDPSTTSINGSSVTGPQSVDSPNNPGESSTGPVQEPTAVSTGSSDTNPQSADNPIKPNPSGINIPQASTSPNGLSDQLLDIAAGYTIDPLKTDNQSENSSLDSKPNEESVSKIPFVSGQSNSNSQVENSPNNSKPSKNASELTSAPNESSNQLPEVSVSSTGPTNMQSNSVPVNAQTDKTSESTYDSLTTVAGNKNDDTSPPVNDVLAKNEEQSSDVVDSTTVSATSDSEASFNDVQIVSTTVEENEATTSATESETNTVKITMDSLGELGKNENTVTFETQTLGNEVSS